MVTTGMVWYDHSATPQPGSKDYSQDRPLFRPTDDWAAIALQQLLT